MSLAEMCSTFVKKDTDSGKLLDKDIMEFVTAPWGLGLGATPDVPPLYASQRFILKCYYGLELDNSNRRDIIIKDQFNEVELYRFNEVEYARYLMDEHRININDFGDRPNLVLVCGRRSGKCITGDSLILTDKGIYRIEDLGREAFKGDFSSSLEESFYPLDIGVIQEKGKRSRSAYFYQGGVKNTFCIRTKDGYSIEGTANHRVKVMSKEGLVSWRYLDDIRSGDFIALNRNTDLWSEDKVDLRRLFNSSKEEGYSSFKYLDDSLGFLVGYIMGGGSYEDSFEPRIYKKFPSLKKYQQAKRACHILFHKLSINTDTIDNLPRYILRSPKSVICSFLKGFLESSGKEKYIGSYISLCLKRESLARDLQMVLLNLGVVSKVKTKIHRDSGRYTELLIYDPRSIIKFSSLVGLVPKDYCSGGKNKGKLNPYASQDSIPYQRNKIRDLFESLSLGPRRKNKSYIKELRQKLRFLEDSLKGTFSYSDLHSLLGCAKEMGFKSKELSHFEDIKEMDYYYSEVSSIEEGENLVYDLNVPHGSSFVANGMTNHNTTISI